MHQQRVPWARRAAEILGRGVVLRRRLPREFGAGRIYVGPSNGGLKYWRHDMWKVDPSLLRLAQRHVRRGMKVWDVGANVGLFSFASAFVVGPEGLVLALEPDVDNAALLLRTARTLDPATYARVQVVVAAASGPGARVGQLSIASRARAGNALLGFGSTQMGAEAERRSVALVTLDELAAEVGSPDLVKIDVEGAEVGVLEGATAMLSRDRPVFYIEVNGDTAPIVAHVLRDAGYRIFDGENASPEPKEIATPAGGNWLALPPAPRAR